VKSTRLQRSTTNLPNLLNTVAQSNTDALPQSSQETASNATQNNSHIEAIPEFVSRKAERVRTAASRRFSGMLNFSCPHLL
jgi:hypothetical protein